MGVDAEVLIGVAVVTVLAILLTGPGMWSEKWGWSAMRKRRRATDAHPREQGREKSDAPTPPR